MIATYRLIVEVFKNYNGELIVSREWWKNGEFWNDKYYRNLIDRNFKDR
jgi:hypothetical protein